MMTKPRVFREGRGCRSSRCYLLDSRQAVNVVCWLDGGILLLFFNHRGYDVNWQAGTRPSVLQGLAWNSKEKFAL